MRRFSPNLIAMAVCVVHCWVGLEGAEVKTFSAEYDRFDQKDYEFLELIGDAHIDDDALQLTPLVPGTEDVTVGLRSGRVLLKQPFRMWEEDTNDVASFNTSFLFDVATVPGEVSQGLAFVIAPDLYLPPNSIGPFLGLTSSTTDASEANKLVAVEFDTYKDDRFDDPDNNHVGIDVNSVRSVKTQSLTPYNITLNAIGAHFYNAWVDYDGVNRVIDVYIVEQFDLITPPKPHSPVLSATLNLKDHLDQYSYLGFSASTGYGAAFNVVHRWNLTVHHFSDPKIKTETKPPPLVRVFRVMMILVLVLVPAAVIGYRFYKRKTASSSRNLMRTLKCLPGMQREFKFRDLNKATNNFDNKNKLGQGGFGVVYRGLLPKDKVEMWFSRENIKGQLDFVAGSINPGIATFEMEYGHWVEEHDRQISDLRNALHTEIGELELRIFVDGGMRHYFDLFAMKATAAKADVFYLMSGMWKTSAERFFFWIGGFRPSELLKVLLSHLEPLSEQQRLDLDNLAQSCQQAEDTLSQGMEKLHQILGEAITKQLGEGNYLPQIGAAIEKLEALVRFVGQADHLRQETLQQISRILTTRQAARGLLALGEYFQRLRALSSLWSSRPRESS